MPRPRRSRNTADAAYRWPSGATAEPSPFSARRLVLPMNFDMKSGAEAHALHTLRAVLCGLEHREVPPPRESAAVYHRFRFMERIALGVFEHLAVLCVAKHRPLMSAHMKTTQIRTCASARIGSQAFCTLRWLQPQAISGLMKRGWPAVPVDGGALSGLADPVYDVVWAGVNGQVAPQVRSSVAS